MSFDLGTYTFFLKREDLFQNCNLDGTFQERMMQLKERMQTLSGKKPLIVISGAGPAGLIRAIQSLSNGNPTKIIERRAKGGSGRKNTVALTKMTIAILQYCGVYQYLIEQKLIYPPNKDGFICVRICDLEKALKVVLHELNAEDIIEYDAKITAIDSSKEKINLAIESSANKTIITNVDLLINTEGARSTTNELLGIKRTEVLSKTPVIAAICKDNRPRIVGINSFFIYTWQSFVNIANTLYYHALFLARFIFSKKFRSQITGALILPTPGQNYIGCAFSDDINHRIDELKKQGDEKNYFAFVKHWINLAVCAANLLSLIEKFKRGPYFYSASNLPLDQFEIVHIGADHADKNIFKINESKILLAGDASATVDPTTGLGCNTAIQSSVDFLDYLWDFDNLSEATRIKEYQSKTKARIDFIHEESRRMRSYYRPDTLMSMSMFKSQPLTNPDVQNNNLSQSNAALNGI